jgi:ribosome-associated protein
MIKQNITEAPRLKDDSAMDLALKILNSCSEAKGKDLTLLDVSNVFDLASFFVIVSARSDRQVQGISNRIMANLAHDENIHPISRDGYDEGHWVLMDYGDVIVHIFYEPMREHYDLERLWKNAKSLPLPSELIEQNKKAA